MRSFTFLLFVALAAVALAAPTSNEIDDFELEVELDNIAITLEQLRDLGFSDEDIENYLFGGLVKKFKGKIQELYNKVCSKNNTDVCKKWAKEHITEENVEKAWKEIKPLVKKYCAKKSNKLCVAVRIIL